MHWPDGRPKGLAKVVGSKPQVTADMESEEIHKPADCWKMDLLKPEGEADEYADVKSSKKHYFNSRFAHTALESEWTQCRLWDF